MKDIIIIGGGVVGSAIARELSKYELNITVVEKNSDVSEGVSKANSGIVHAGFNEEIGTLKGKLNIIGNRMFDKLSEDLDFSFKRNGALVLGFKDEDLKTLEKLKEKGENLGVKNLKVIGKEEILKLQGNIKEDVLYALYAGDSGIVNPYEMTLALAENAVANGVEFKLNSEVLDIKKESGNFKVTLSNGEVLNSKVVINAAGLFGDKINNMISEDKLQLQGVKGEYLLFDKVAGKLVDYTLFNVPQKHTKGILITKTVDGNLLIGPDANKVKDRNDVSVTIDGTNEIKNKALSMIEDVPVKRIITAFAGVRPHIKDDFIIEEVKNLDGFINVIGIDSPGLTAAPAIAIYVKDILKEKIKLKEKDDFINKRKGILKFNELSLEEKNKIIKVNSKYGKMICKCELITEGEIIDAINRPLGAKTLDGVKRRTRATMGGCQGVGCLIPIATIISRELNIPLNQVMKNNSKSNVLGFKED